MVVANWLFTLSMHVTTDCCPDKSLIEQVWSNFARSATINFYQSCSHHSQITRTHSNISLSDCVQGVLATVEGMDKDDVSILYVKNVHADQAVFTKKDLVQGRTQGMVLGAEAPLF